MIFFLVPDSDDDMDGIDGLDMDSGGSDEQKAQLDQGEASRAAQKVDLDLDDAPFLEDEDEDEDEDYEEEVEEEPKPQKERKPLPAWLTGKPFLIGAPLALLLIVGAIWFFTRPEPEEAPAPPPIEEPVEEEVQEEEVPPEPAKPPPPPTKPNETLIRLAPFWVEQDAADGKVRFLIARFALTTTDDRLAVEFNRKLLIIRDALYYYLKNKDLEFLSAKDNSEKLKADLLTVINQYMGSGEFKTLLVEEYLVK